jgi:Na+/H+ antiporter NhaD/arsenite permease-like protein
VALKSGGFAVIALFALTIAATVLLHQWLHLPSFLGMMSGLGLLMLCGWFIRRRERGFDVFDAMRRVEWDTLLFFYGVVLCVGGLSALGFLALLSQHSYLALGPSLTNIGVGVASAIVDNIPIMFAVLSMNPEMSHGQWLLVTLTAGVGGSLLSIGSAAGVALMGQARGVYTFVSHLKWIWAIALGYAASIWLHFLLNASLF